MNNYLELCAAKIKDTPEQEVLMLPDGFTYMGYTKGKACPLRIRHVGDTIVFNIKDMPGDYVANIYFRNHAGKYLCTTFDSFENYFYFDKIIDTNGKAIPTIFDVEVSE